VRPEHIDVVQDGGMWQGTVGVAEHLGSDTFFHIHNTGLTDTITVRAIGDVSLKHGDTIHLNPRMDEMHKFDAQGLRID
jgi:multiple sugar transport system ATP-binding protein